MKSLDISSQFIGDLDYENMKTRLNKVDILYFSKTLTSGQVIIQTLKDMINKSDVPDTFLYMAMVESKFLTTAKSNKSAAGLWQIMPKTAKHLKLTINNKVDERLDPIKSTEVAINYLQYLHSRFDKWYLVAMAYNCGETRLAKAIKKSGSDDIFTLLDDKKTYIPKETKRYIRKLIVASLIAHSDAMLLEAQLLNANGDNTKLKALPVKKGTSLKKIASSYNIPVKTLKKYNAHILKGETPKGKKKYCIYIPEDKINKGIDICFKSTKTGINEETTTVSISQKSPDKKTALTRKQKKSPLYDKDKIKTTKIQKDKPTKSKREEKLFAYTVKKGEDLFDISKKFNNKVATLERLNGKLSQKLTAGIVLSIKR